MAEDIIDWNMCSFSTQSNLEGRYLASQTHEASVAQTVPLPRFAWDPNNHSRNQSTVVGFALTFIVECLDMGCLCCTHREIKSFS